MSTIFSTDSLNGKDRFNYWNDVVFKLYAPCLGTIEDRDDFQATTTVQQFGNTELSQVNSDGIRYDRRKADLRTRPQDDIFISQIIDGQGSFSQNDQQLKHEQGQILIYDSGKPYSFEYNQRYKARLLRIPRPLMQAKLDNLDHIGGTLIVQNSLYGRLISNLMDDSSYISTSQELSQNDDFILPTLEMITTAIERAVTQMRGNTPTDGSKQLQEVKRYIRANIGDENLNLEQIAIAHNMSVRTLSRLFAQIGQTPRGWLQEQRLSMAYDALINRRVSNITQAAFTFGYKDLSHFSRTFKKRYGYSPKTIIHS
ncbi:helix-turn-helix domain-containing protein [Celerinatantimonas sp. MCCC 1A17872]|uniref:helix-turn-helix domain-containing protein n=1 Tax=Celerinatantimonas sp. MCCC 1A17872 TaxID=3177514 RepID=UPI0038BE8419